MFTKRFFLSLLTVAILLMSFTTTSNVRAWSGCGTSYTVQRGDTLGIIANRCGTTLAALRLANPNIGNGYWIYAGQTLLLPGAHFNNGNGYATYIVARGDTLRSLAARYGTSMAALANLNGIYNYNLIYEGQRLIVPAGGAPTPAPQPSPVAGGTYIVQWGDTLRKIADRMNVSVNDLLAVNTQIWNPNWIYIGEVIYLPQAPSLYTVKPGDTLKIIAARYGTSVDNLLARNPQIWNPNWIYVGEVIRVW